MVRGKDIGLCVELAGNAIRARSCSNRGRNLAFAADLAIVQIIVR
jgi:hypothetical protein